MAQEVPILVVQEGRMAGQRWALSADTVTIGRGEDCDIIFPERQVSRRHARIRRVKEGYILEDLGSKNGTYVNGCPLEGPYLLRDGDEIQIALCVKLAFVGPEATAPLFFDEGERGGLRLDKEGRRVWVRGRELDPPLSPAQYRLLELLYERAGRVCSRDEIVQAVWPEAVEGAVSDQAIDALVRRLRERIAEVDPHHQYIVTVRGHGFRLDNFPAHTDFRSL